MPELNRISGKITLDGKDYVMGLSSVGSATDKVTEKIERQFEGALSKVESIGKKMSLAMTVPLLAIGYKSAQAFNNADEALVRLKATLDATGNAVGRTVGQLTKTASEIQRATTFDDEDVLAMSATLAKFGNVVGDTFDRAQRVITDYAAASGQTLAMASEKVGRALSDPTTGMMMLRREGYALTAQQKKTVEQMLKMGDVAGAQAVILGMLESKTRGTAKAMAEIGSGRIKQAWNDVGDAMEKVGGVIVTAIQPAVRIIRDLAIRFQELPAASQTAIVAIGAIAAAAGPAVVAFAKIAQAYMTMQSALTSATAATYGLRAASLMLNPALLIVAGAVAIVTAALVIGEKQIEKNNKTTINFNRALNATPYATAKQLRGITDLGVRLEEARKVQAKLNEQIKQQQGAYYKGPRGYTNWEDEQKFNKIKSQALEKLNERKKEVEDLLGELKDVKIPSAVQKKAASYAPTEAQTTRAQGIYDETRTPLERYKESMKELDALKRSGSFEGMGDVYEREVKRITEALNTALPAVVGVTNAMQGAFDSAFSSMISGTVTMRQAIKQMVDDVLSELARMVASNLFKTLLNFAIPGLFGGGAGGGILGFLFGKGSAKGNAFDAPVRPFAKGGSFVDGPKMFPMDGGMGKMGEAGPEGVFPLARDGSGRLGIRGDNSAIRDLEKRLTAMIQNGNRGEVHQHFHDHAMVSTVDSKTQRRAARQIANMLKLSGAVTA
jgi:hypothetical protein